MGNEQGLLLVGHGSRSPASEAEMRLLAQRVAHALPEVDVELGYLEMSEPPAGVVLDKLVANGCRHVVVLPVMLLAAGHGKSDVPAVVLEARQRHPAVAITFGSPLGVARELVAALGDAVTGAAGAAGQAGAAGEGGAVGEAGGLGDAVTGAAGEAGAGGAAGQAGAAGVGPGEEAGLPLLVVARGTSDPDANAEAHRAARLVAEWARAPFVHTAFTGVTWPLVPAGLATMAALGFRRFALGFWFLCDGRLVERARADVAAFSDRTGVEVVDAGYLGPNQPAVSVLLERYRMALAGAAPVYSCDTCAYRAPFPGLEDRVAQAVGVGHSHLAEEHRHHVHLSLLRGNPPRSAPTDDHHHGTLGPGGPGPGYPLGGTHA